MRDAARARAQLDQYAVRGRMALASLRGVFQQTMEGMARAPNAPGHVRMPAATSEAGYALQYLCGWTCRTVAHDLCRLMRREECSSALRALMRLPYRGNTTVGRHIRAAALNAVSTDAAETYAVLVTDVVEFMVLQGSAGLGAVLRSALAASPAGAAEFSARYPGCAALVAGTEMSSYAPLMLLAAPRVIADADLYESVQGTCDGGGNKRRLALWVFLCAIPRDAVMATVNTILGENMDEAAASPTGSISSRAAVFKYHLGNVIADAAIACEALDPCIAFLAGVLTYADRTNRRPSRRQVQFAALCGDLRMDAMFCVSGQAPRPLDAIMKTWHGTPPVAAKRRHTT